MVSLVNFYRCGGLSFFEKSQRYFHTLRYLKPVQIWGRIVFKLIQPKPDLRPASNARLLGGGWQIPATRRISMLSPTRFRFLNLENTISSTADWNSILLPKLWLYNLHYFDDLNAEFSDVRKDWHRELIARWIIENPPSAGAGWDPYPLSLRIVNWIKWALAGNELDGAVHHSLAVQTRFLVRRLEHHLLGNHLFANAKALVFSGCYFEGDKAEQWLRLGMEILEREITEQILADGGHFERSTMYQALAFEDMLDLVNLANAFPDSFVPWKTTVSSWPEIVSKMGGWLRAMSHPDGEIAFFNDAAVGIAPSPSVLLSYADRLRLPTIGVGGEVIELAPSGYIRVALGPAILLIDVAPIGPDYLPGHAHADTLSYELSLFGQRVLVNSGTSCYGVGLERQWERSTAAHNTVEIDGQDSSEVWAGFRVARRAYPFDVSVKRDDDVVIVEAAHDGYRRLTGNAVHRRTWTLRPQCLEVVDTVQGNFSEMVSRVYFHPDVQVIKADAEGSASWLNQNISWESSAVDSDVAAATWYPEFGISVPNKCLRMAIPGSKKTAGCRFSLSWNTNSIPV